jgi:hypothetical protein
MAYLLPQDAQLVAEQPLHDDEEDAETPASPVPAPLPLVTKPHRDMSLDRSVPLQEGHWGTSLPRTRSSKVLLQVLQVYSNSGMVILPDWSCS